MHPGKLYGAIYVDGKPHPDFPGRGITSRLGDIWHGNLPTNGVRPNYVRVW